MVSKIVGRIEVMADRFGSVREAFEAAPNRFQPSRAGSMDAVFQFDIIGEGGGQWYLTIKDKTLTVTEGTHDSPKVTITASADDWLKLVNRRADATSLYMMGRIKVKGPLYLAEQLLYVLG